MVLTPVQARTLGSLIEKQLTTPQQYPMTLNALVVACNQTTNRDPVVDYNEHLVENAVTELKADGLVRFVLPSHGRSATRYRQVFDERSDLDVRELALVAVLLLRGPQTVGELRARTDRMCQFDDVATVEAELQLLSERSEPLTRRLPRRPGHKEDRWVDALTEVAAQGEVPGRYEPTDPAADDEAAPTLASVLEELSELRAKVIAMRTELDLVRVQLGD